MLTVHNANSLISMIGTLIDGFSNENNLSLEDRANLLMTIMDVIVHNGAAEMHLTDDDFISLFIRSRNVISQLKWKEVL